MTCLVCGKPVKPVIGRGRQPDYCSVRCRRKREKARARWDRRAAAVAEDGMFALNRDMEFRTDEQRQYWQAELDRARATLGPRP